MKLASMAVLVLTIGLAAPAMSREAVPLEHRNPVPHAAMQARATMTHTEGTTTVPSVTSMAQDIARAYTTAGAGSDPACRPGTSIILADGRTHPCQ